ncbi:TlpA disulfide reductase family protein [Azorhizobium doebereinerae]|uniref:TlpA disulfide reductase family protein n=1 Tax=Azorhizobium doebereinerae TaxID=281091 RepID=UPI00040E52C3|nr:TlpA disulfide reductase family protein [Azorhizobium doebereinerae]
MARSAVLAVLGVLCGTIPASAQAPAAAAGPDGTLQPYDATLPGALQLPVLDGASLDLRDLKGRVVLVHFFATWCEPCREELPALSRFASDNRSRVAVIAVDVAEVDVRVRRFLDDLPVAFPVALDRDRAFTRQWAVSALPATIVLDRALRPRLRAVGEVAWDGPAARDAIAALVSEPISMTSGAVAPGAPNPPGGLNR